MFVTFAVREGEVPASRSSGDVPRPLREEIAGGLFHVYARGNNKRQIYLDDRDRLVYLDLLARTVRQTGWHCLSYCLMDNHVHLVLETPEPNLAAGMQQFHGQYARRFNDRYGVTGHLFDSRYGAVRIKSDPQLVVVLRYVAFNPVQAGLCRRPEQHAWSSHAPALSDTRSPALNTDRLFWHLSGLSENPREFYAQLIDDWVPT